MAGIYIHIPFCRQACNYCNFHFTTSLAHKNELIAALLKEVEIQGNYLGNEAVETVYFGGGTPSLLPVPELASIVEKLKSNFNITGDAEITLEANPDDISENIPHQWRKTGINRLSLGIQSFFEEDLKWMNRAHTARQAISSLQQAKQCFSNITIDLIYGTPYLTHERWKQNVEQVIALHIPHISCYALTVEPKTPLQKMIRLGKTEDINPGKQAEQFLLLMEWLEDAGYEHYEISNFAKPGFRSRHNSSYWQGKKYLGLGPSAHSFNGAERQWNIANNAVYINSLKQNMLSFEKEALSINQRLNEYIMISLRTKEGIDLSVVEQSFGEKNKKRILQTGEKFIQQHKMTRSASGRLVLTKEGKLFADGIAADFFIV